MDSANANYCYILHSPSTQRTYNGYTNNLPRRLRQHNQELVGGARATKRAQDWEFACYVTSPTWDRVAALKFEWHVKYPTRKRPRPRCYDKVQGRLASLAVIFGDPRYADTPFVLHCPECYRALLPPLPPNVTLDIFR